MIKGSLQEEDITVINICIPNIGAPKYINTNRHKGRNWWEYNNSRILYIPLTWMDRSRQKNQ